MLGFTIEVTCESDAFADGNLRAESARILRKIADNFEKGEIRATAILDVNGGTVGQFTWTSEAE